MYNQPFRAAFGKGQGLARFRRSPPLRVDILFIAEITEYFPCDYFPDRSECGRPVHRGRLRRRARVGAGCGVLRAWLVTALPGGVRQNRPSAITSGTCECTNARPKGTAHVQRPKVWPRRARSQQPPRWSAERRASRVMGRKAPRSACGRTSLARRRVPLHPSACRRSASLT